MSPVVAGVGLAVLGGLDAAFAGFRASCGRLGLVRHRAEDVRASLRGLGLGSLLVAPVVVVVLVDAVVREERREVYASAGARMLAVYLPYGVLVLLALAAYGTLSWRRRFLATAVLLGPLTLLRPLVAVAGAVAVVLGGDVPAMVLAVASVAAVLVVEPLVGRRWYAVDRPSVLDAAVCPQRPPERLIRGTTLE